MTPPEPPWDFRLDGDEGKFVTWLEVELDNSYDPWSQDDFWRLAQTDYQPERRDLDRRLQRARVSIAARDKDIKILEASAARDHELATLAFSVLTTPERQLKQGQQRHRSRDLTDLKRLVREDAMDELRRIQFIIKHHYNNRRNGYDNIAIEVAARRAGIKPKQLRSYRSNLYPKKSRPR